MQTAMIQDLTAAGVVLFLRKGNVSQGLGAGMRNKQPSDRRTASRGKAPRVTVVMTASAYMVPRITAQDQEALNRLDTLVTLIIEGSEAKLEPRSR